MNLLKLNKVMKYKVITFLSKYDQNRTIQLQKLADKGWRLIAVDNDVAHLEKNDTGNK